MEQEEYNPLPKFNFKKKSFAFEGNLNLFEFSKFGRFEFNSTEFGKSESIRTQINETNFENKFNKTNLRK